MAIQKPKPEANVILIPSSIFKNRSLSVLESVVQYLHDLENLSFHQIALLLNRDNRTIWTVYDRVKRKRST